MFSKKEIDIISNLRFIRMKNDRQTDRQTDLNCSALSLLSMKNYMLCIPLEPSVLDSKDAQR